MTTCVEKSCTFGLPCMSFMNAYQFLCVLLFLEMWDVIVPAPDQCLPFYIISSENYDKRNKEMTITSTPEFEL